MAGIGPHSPPRRMERDSSSRFSGNGTGQAVADGDGFSLVVSGTDSRSSLNVFTDNFGLITGLSVDGSLRALNARDCTIGGDASITGTLGSAALFAVSSEAGNTIHFGIGGAGVASSLAIELVSDVTLTTASPIAALRVRRWADLNAEPDVITAPSIGLVRTFAGRGVTGSFEADLNLTDVGGVSLGKMNVAGGLNGATIRAAGSVGAVTVSAMHDSLLLAGAKGDLAALPTAASDFVAASSIGSFVVTGKAAATFSDTVIAASSIGKVRMGKVGTNAVARTTFGVAAVSIGDYRRGMGRGAVVGKNVTQLGVFDSDGFYVGEIVG